MMNNEHMNYMAKTLNKTIDNFIDEYDIRHIELIGLLEIIKAERLKMIFEDKDNYKEGEA